MTETDNIIAFAGDHCIADGARREVIRLTREFMDRWPDEPILLLDRATSQPVEIDFRGDVAEVLARLPSAVESEASPRGPGRPKLGVVAREVTLLPRHWDWLAQQRGGASVALRRLIDDARRHGDGADRVRQAQDVAYRFLSAMAGNKPGYEEAIRALFAGDADRFAAQTEAWPADVRDHARHLAAAAFAQASPAAAVG